MDRIPVIAPDGQWGTVDPGELDHALTAGYQVETPEQAQARELADKYGNRDLEAAGLAGIRSFSFGLSDWALRGTGLYKPEELRGIQQANPEADTAGDIAGTAIGLLVPGPSLLKGAVAAENLAARGVLRGAEALAPRVAESALGRIATKTAAGALGGAVGGGLWGAGRAISEFALEDDPQLSAEKLISHVADGMKFGAAGGGAISGLEGLVTESGRAIARSVFGRSEYRAAEQAAKAGELPLPAAGPATGEEASAARATEMRREVQTAQDRAVDLGELGDMAEDPELGGLIGAGLKGVKQGADWATSLVEQVGEKQARPVIDAAQRIGLNVPTSEGMMRKGLDLRMGENRALRRAGLQDVAPAMLRDDPRLPAILADRSSQVPQGERILGLIEQKAKEGVELKNAALQQLDSAAEERHLFNGPEVGQRLMNKLAIPLEKGSTFNEPIVKAVMDQALDLEKRGSLTFTEADRLITDLDKHLYAAQSTPSMKPLAVTLRKIRYEMAQELRGRVDALSQELGQPELGAAFRQGKLEAHAMLTLAPGVRNRTVIAAESNNFFGLGDMMRGNSIASAALGAGGVLAAPFSIPLSAGLGIGSMLVSKWTREQLPFKLAFWLKRAEAPGPEQILAKSFWRQVKNMTDAEALAGAQARATQLGTVHAAQDEAARAGVKLGEAAAATSELPMGQAVTDAFPEMGVPGGPTEPPPALDKSVFGKFSPVLRQAVAAGPAALIATHVLLSNSSPDYVDQMAQAGFPDLTPREDQRAFSQAMGLAGLGKAHQAQVDAIQGHAQGFLDRKKGTATRAALLTPEQVKEHAQDLAMVATNPQALTAKIDPGGSLAQLAPQTHLAAAQVAQRAAQVLLGAVPKEPPPSPLKGFGSDWTPARAEIARYQRIAQAVLRPMSVLEDMRRGAVDLEAVQALRTVYPNVANQMAQTFLSEAGGRGAKLTYQQRLMVSALAGAPLEPALDPMALLSYQRGSQSAAARAARGNAGGRVSNPELATVSQRLEAR